MELPFITLDVFTKTRYAGNPLAVITIPSTQDPKPTQEQKQAIAREFNLSETVFVHDVADHDVNKTREIDIFLTNAEVPFAGHPTIGTAVSLLAQGVDTLVTKAGPITLTEISPGVVKAGIPHNVHLHQRQLGEGYLSSDDELRTAQQAAPVFSIVKGMSFALVKLSNLELLGKVKPSTAHVPVGEVLDEGWQEGFLSSYYWVLLGTREEDGITVCSIRTRMVEVALEDPATGSAACALCCWLQSTQTATSRKDRNTRYEVTQGVEMGRESNIIVDITVKDNKIDTVSLAGTATQVMRGHVTI